MVVYADILFCVNLIVNYFLLLATARLCRRQPQRLRVLAGALIGAAYAMILFVRGLPPWVLMFSKLAASALILWAAFGWLSLKQYLRDYVMFFIVNFLFAGLMLALWLLVAPSGMVFFNGVVYFNISAVALVGFTAVAYGAAEFFSRLYQRRGVENTIYDVTLGMGQKEVRLTGFLDTGNTLKDVYTGYPVAVCTYEAIRAVLPAGLADVFASPLEDAGKLERLMTPHTHNRFKFIPYSTVGFCGILPAFRPERMLLDDGKRRFEVQNVYVAVAPQTLAKGSYDILLNAEMVGLEYAAHTASRFSEAARL